MCDAVLGQAEPSFAQLRLEVPSQARIMLVQAVLQWSQRYASLQLDAMHAARLQMLLEQAAPEQSSIWGA